MKAIDAATLSSADALSLDILRRNLERSIEAARFPDHLLPINQFYNLAAQLAQLGTGTGAQPFRTVADYDNWAQARRADSGAVRPGDRQHARGRDEGRGTQPDVLMTKVLSQLDALAVAKARGQPVLEAGRELPRRLLGRRPQPPDRRLSHPDRRYRAAGLRTRLRDYIRDDYLPNCRKTVGLDALPDGAGLVRLEGAGDHHHLR